MKTLIEEGRLLKIDQGEYSDYHVIGFFKVIKSFDWLLELMLFRDSQEDKDYFNYDRFLFFLLTKKYLEELKYDTLYLGGYGEYDSVKHYRK